MNQSPLSVKDVFDRAHEITDAAERRAYLDESCGDNAELRRQVEGLLRAYDEAGSFLNKPAAQLEGTSDAAPGQWLDPNALPDAPIEGVGSRIKQYKLLQQIGEGGMGVVFMAEQQEPVRRMVALKVIKAGMDTAQVVARFEQERQALALMDHPNIAKVLDAGTTNSGRPFFVMELVKGIPMTRYCDEQRMSPKQRLELFVPVCQAIQHAHQKGIIHRDIKPSNVLIAAYDGKPVPKVIDFGVAKAAGAKLTERTLFTGFGGLVGTFEYMSPEQAEFNALDIDTRSDVYSLGVLLYELLTGSTPLTRLRIKDAAIVEVLRLIREEEPPKPSTRLSESKDSLASVSAQRHSEPVGLVKAMRGEVDWIVMKALDKDRTRRYDTANGMARDIERYLAEEAVEAGPPSARYRLRKLAWKHRRGLATATALLLLVLVGAGVSTVLAVWALREERLANQRLDEATTQKERAEQAETEVTNQLAVVQQQKERAQKAETEAKGNEAKSKQSEADAKAVLEYFQFQVMRAGRPQDQKGDRISLRDAVDQARDRIADSFKDRPLREASIRNSLGLMYRHAGEYLQAIRQHERALALQEAQLAADHPDTLGTKNNLALAYLAAGKQDLALPLCAETLKQMEAKLGDDHPDTLECRDNLANAYLSASRTAEAIPLLEQTLKQRKAKLGADHPNTLTSRNNLVWAYQSAGRTADAICLLEQALKHIKDERGADDPDFMPTGMNIVILQKMGRYQERYRVQLAKLGPDHIDTLLARRDMAQMYMAANQLDKAEPILAEVTDRMKDRANDDPIRVFTIGLLWNCLTTRERTMPDSWLTFRCKSLLGGVLLGQKKYAAAEPLLLKGYQGMKERESKIPPQGKVRLTEALERLMQLYEATGKKDEAAKWRKQLDETKKAAEKEKAKK